MTKTCSVQSVVIILPQISKDLDIPVERQQCVISSYSLTSGAFLLLCGKLADVYGKRVLFIGGCFWMVATTLGAAFSPVEVCMYVMRALQGLVCLTLILFLICIGIDGYRLRPSLSRPQLGLLDIRFRQDRSRITVLRSTLGEHRLGKSWATCWYAPFHIIDTHS
jgi:MFS family permease